MKNLWCLLLFIGCSVVGLGQQDSMFTIEGTVWDEETGEPIENAFVFLIKNEINVDSILTDENGFYKFEIPDTGCYGLKATFEGYLSVSTTKPYCVFKSQNIRFKHDFYLQAFIDEKSYENYLMPPVIDTIPIQIFIKNNDDKIVENTQLKAFYKNEDTTVFYIENGEIIIDYVRGKELFLEINKQGFEHQLESFFFPPEMSCGMSYIENPITNEEYDAHIASRYTIYEFQKIHFTLKKDK